MSRFELKLNKPMNKKSIMAHINSFTNPKKNFAIRRERGKIAIRSYYKTTPFWFYGKTNTYHDFSVFHGDLSIENAIKSGFVYRTRKVLVPLDPKATPVTPKQVFPNFGILMKLKHPMPAVHRVGAWERNKMKRKANIK